ncbi:MAG: signal peptidase I [Oscillospiraceae bacterium]|nr:signal peptidase I [Oscillospiraceae bacterium]
MQDDEIILEQEEEQTPEEPGGWRFEVYSTLRDFVWILTIVTILFVFVIRLVGVDGSSMYPTLYDRDYLLLTSNVLDRHFENGDIVVLSKSIPEVPQLDSTPIVKRVIATEGQTVDIDFDLGTVTVDGVKLDEPYINDLTHLNYGDGLTYPATVPEGCIFVMGDNRNNSTDSRYAPVGMVDTRYVVGSVLLRVFPGRTTDARGAVTGGRDFSRLGVVK